VKSNVNSLQDGPTFVFAVLLIVVSFALQSTYRTTPIVRVVSSLVRVGQHDLPRGSTQAEVWAARGECASFQIVIRGPSRNLSTVNITFEDLIGSNRTLLPKSSLDVYREQYVYVSRGSEVRGGNNRPQGPGWYPDGLIPFVDPDTHRPVARATLKAAPFDLPAETNQPLWVDVCIPRDVAPGPYHGTLTVTSNQGKVPLPILVHVWHFELPLKPTLQTAFIIYNDTISKPPIYYAGQGANQEMLLRHRIMPVPVNHEQEREFIDKLGLDIAQAGFHEYATGGNCNQPPAPSVGELQAERAAHQPDIQVYLQIADEVSDCTKIFPALRDWARNARSAGMRTLLTAIPSKALLDDGSGTGRSVADIWALLPKHFVSNPSDVATAIRKGDQVWSYTALVQDDFSPKWAIDFDPINYRILGGFLNQSLGLRGLLYWAVNSWVLKAPRDPWNQVQNLGPDGSYPPGEGMLVYPGEKVGLSGFAPSMRLKWIRDSVQDFEYVEILRRLGREDQALQVARTVASDWKNWTHDPDVLETARLKLGQEIDRISAPSATREEAPLRREP